MKLLPGVPHSLLQGVSGAKMEKACDEAHITLNKNAVVGDVSAMNPGGVRIGKQMHLQAVTVGLVPASVPGLKRYCCPQLALHGCYACDGAA
jgi:hypothetical protein